MFFRKLCKVIGVKTSQIYNDRRGIKGCWNVYITNYDNFKILIEEDCIAHETRRNNLNQRFLTSKKSRYLDYLMAINNGNDTSRKIINRLKISESNSRNTLLNLSKQMLVIRELEDNYYKYRLSEKGKRELELYQQVVNEGIKASP